MINWWVDSVFEYLSSKYLTQAKKKLISVHLAKLKTRAWRRLFLDLARTPEGVTDGLSTGNRFVTARAGLATARARLGG